MSRVVAGSLERRVGLHQALGDVHRLAIVDALRLSDHTPSELLSISRLPSNLLAFHLDVLEGAGIVSRHVSQGDRRRRYVTLNEQTVADVEPDTRLALGPGPVLFVCTHNAARSPLAAALWRHRTGRQASSAGTDPAPEVHPHALEVGRRHGLDLSGIRPRDYDTVASAPELVVSVCDRAREGGLPFAGPTLHWSVPDPAAGDRNDFERAYALIRARVDRLARAVAA